MDFSTQVAKALDTEHRAQLSLLSRIEQAVIRPGTIPPDFDALAREMTQQLAQEVGRHFDFEEQHLFTRLQDVGDGGMVLLLTEEHDAIRAVAEELLPLLRAAATGTPAGGNAAMLRSLALELVERQVSHIQKETFALLPMLDDLLDEDTDREMAMAYSSH